MRLGPRQILVLFTIGALGGLAGDQAHVASGATRYLDHSLPFVWRSEIWFPVAVGLGTVSVADLRLRLAPARAPFDLRQAGEAIAAVLAIYAVTALVTDEATGSSVLLVTMLAALVSARYADGWPGLTCGLLAAIVGPVVEIVVVHNDIAEYGSNVDGLFGVAPWLPMLYFAFGVVVARLAEMSVATRA
ncbi:hypothetical protein BH10ACT11_BH10ACT11_09480 [soil metagenome]